jgi:hypothetical protein
LSFSSKPEYSSTTLYQVSYHIQYLLFESDNRISPYLDPAVAVHFRERGVDERVVAAGEGVDNPHDLGVEDEPGVGVVAVCNPR